MGENIDRLAEILEKQLAVTRRLLDLAKDARAAAVAADPLLLVQIVSDQEENAARLEGLEVERVAISREVAVGLGLDTAKPPRLTAIADRAGAKDAARLRRLGGRLRACALELRQANTYTREVLEASLVHIDDFFCVLAEARSRDGSYGTRRERQRAGGAKAAIMDREA